jgi:hypothetical protein
MRFKSDDKSNPRRPWQFTLKSLMIGVTMLCLVLSLGAWLGLRGYIGSFFAVVTGTLGFAVYRRRILLAIFCVILIAGPILYYYFGYWTLAVYVCSICEKDKDVILIGNINSYVYVSEQRETECSEFYQDVISKPHEHQWRLAWGIISHWRGRYETFDAILSSGSDLQILYHVSQKVDQATFKEVLEDFNEQRQDRNKAPMYFERCDQILAGDSKE